MTLNKYTLNYDTDSAYSFGVYLKKEKEREQERRRHERIKFGEAHERAQHQQVKLTEKHRKSERTLEKLAPLIEHYSQFDDGKNKSMQALGKLGGRPRKKK